MPIRSYVNGDMSFAAMVQMDIAYIILAGIMGIKWGLLYRITGNIWAGLGDHLFNNTVAANMLHVVSQNGADKLQIVRIMAAQIISFAFVIAIYYCKKRNAKLPLCDKGGNRMELVKLTHENLDREHICCAISGNKDI